MGYFKKLSIYLVLSCLLYRIVKEEKEEKKRGGGTAFHNHGNCENDTATQTLALVNYCAFKMFNHILSLS